jgi:hypothetical protein
VALMVAALRYKPIGRGLASKCDEHHEYFMGGKGAWQTYHLHVPIVLKSRSLNLLEPSEPFEAYIGIGKKNRIAKHLCIDDQI